MELFQLSPWCALRVHLLIEAGVVCTCCGFAAALIHQSCFIRKKDIRKFLDGIYVSEKGPIGATVPV